MFAAHIRSNHAHFVVQAADSPEKVMSSFKSYSSRALTKAGLETTDRRRWTRHGSTRYLWNDEELRAAIRYVVQEQGEPMALYAAAEWWYC
jgi:REP element-mobilizing transposase RayT